MCDLVFTITCLKISLTILKVSTLFFCIFTKIILAEIVNMNLAQLVKIFISDQKVVSSNLHLHIFYSKVEKKNLNYVPQ